MIDIHCHILPAVDDGAKSAEIAIEMCRMAWQDGIEHIVATPHANNRFPYNRSAFFEQLKQLMLEVNGCPQLTLGCDFHFSYDNFLALLKTPAEFTIGDTHYLLIELDDYSIPASLTANLGQLISSGLVPILTHPERNPLLRQDLSRVLEWVRQGALVQVTADSLTGRWGPPARSAVKWLLKRNAVHVVASDAHGTTSRTPVLSRARAEVSLLAGESVARALVSDNPRAIVSGQHLPYLPKVAPS